VGEGGEKVLRMHSQMRKEEGLWASGDLSTGEKKKETTRTAEQAKTKVKRYCLRGQTNMATRKGGGRLTRNSPEKKDQEKEETDEVRFE